MTQDTCPCGETLPCALDDTGYPWCGNCGEHHRHPETCRTSTSGTTFVIHQVTSPPRPPEHHHRWAWAMLTRGGTVQVCYDCGAERR